LSGADRFGTIQVRGARENNLKNISVDILPRYGQPDVDVLANLSAAINRAQPGRHRARGLDHRHGAGRWRRRREGGI
jgi:hypothetical protein